jgi:hypothetical protein
MDNQPRRITLILGSPDLSGHRWNVSSDGASRLIFVGNFAMLRHGLRSGVAELCQDVERVVLEDGATAVQYLELLSSLPREFVATHCSSGEMALDSSVRWAEGAIESSIRSGLTTSISISAPTVWSICPACFA